MPSNRDATPMVELRRRELERVTVDQHGHRRLYKPKTLLRRIWSTPDHLTPGKRDK